MATQPSTAEKKRSRQLIDCMDQRIELDKEDGDIALFHALILKLEYITKLVTCGVLACVAEDVDRQRYSVEHKLVRADSIGDWVRALHDILTGPPAEFIEMSARVLQKELTQRVGPGDWRYDAVVKIGNAATAAGVKANLGRKTALRQFFDIGVLLRNRTRGHGAPTTSQCSQLVPHLSAGLDAVVERLSLLSMPWAYLHRNLSGKYRVSPLVGDCSPFDYLKRKTGENLLNGVYLFLNRPIIIPLVVSDAEVRDVFLPNGNFKNASFEMLSYVTNDAPRQDGTTWSSPPGRLPPSETEGLLELESFGDAFANVPPKRQDYVPRLDLERRVERELLDSERHPIVSLTGPGGIGKTSVAIAALHAITEHQDMPFEVVLWISARDIDLLETGPKPVAARVVRQVDIAHAAVELLEPEGHHLPGFDAEEYFQSCLARGAAGNTLYVLDNFETVQSPADVFAWIDTHIRPPNKVLITTRIRDFVGDYPIEISGMTEEEAGILVDRQAKRLGIGDLINSAYKEELISESEGHPYVIRILLGQVGRERRAVRPERIVASSEHILRALFERTYSALGPGSQRVFLLLCSWRVLVPEIGVEAVLLRPGNQRFDVASALDELERFSLVERSVSDEEDTGLVGVPLAAAIYGRGKLEASPYSASVEEDRRLLMEFGPGRPKDPTQSVLPRIESLYQAVAAHAQTRPAVFEERRPVLEYLAMQVPRAYLRLAELVHEVGDPHRATEDAKEYVRRFIERAPMADKQDAWLKLANLCAASQDIRGEVHAISEAAILATSSLSDLSGMGNRLNNRIRTLRSQNIDDAWSAEVAEHIARVTGEMERHLGNMEATECSRLAWLYLNVGNRERAREIANIGLSREPTNAHCANLVGRLES